MNNASEGLAKFNESLVQFSGRIKSNVSKIATLDFESKMKGFVEANKKLLEETTEETRKNFKAKSKELTQFTDAVLFRDKDLIPDLSKFMDISKNIPKNTGDAFEVLQVINTILKNVGEKKDDPRIQDDKFKNAINSRIKEIEDTKKQVQQLIPELMKQNVKDIRTKIANFKEKSAFKKMSTEQVLQMRQNLDKMFGKLLGDKSKEIIDQLKQSGEFEESKIANIVNEIKDFRNNLNTELGNAISRDIRDLEIKTISKLNSFNRKAKSLLGEKEDVRERFQQFRVRFSNKNKPEEKIRQQRETIAQMKKDAKGSGLDLSGAIESAGANLINLTKNISSFNVKKLRAGTTKEEFVDKIEELLEEIPKIQALRDDAIQALTKMQTEIQGGDLKNKDDLLGKISKQIKAIEAAAIAADPAVKKLIETSEKEANKEDDNSFLGSFKKGLDKKVEEFGNFDLQLNNAGYRTAQNLSDTMDNVFFNVFKGQTESAKQAWKDFMSSIKDEFFRVLAQMIRNALVKKLFGIFGFSVGGFFGEDKKTSVNVDQKNANGGLIPTYMSGGMVMKAANGMAMYQDSTGLFNKSTLINVGEGSTNPELVVNRMQFNSIISRTIASAIDAMPQMGGGGTKQVIIKNNFQTTISGGNSEIEAKVQQMMMQLPDLMEAQMQQSMNENTDIQNTIQQVASQGNI